MTCGQISLKQIKVRGDFERGMAITGTILGYVGHVFSVIYLIVMVALVVASAPYGS